MIEEETQSPADASVSKNTVGKEKKEYWDSRARRFKESHRASWDDRYMIDLEIETIGNHISRKDFVLDAGCGNGYSTIRQFMNSSPRAMIGMDSSKEMVRYANRAKRRSRLRTLSFHAGDIRNMTFEGELFDVVYTTRVLVNLRDWSEQKKAIAECLRVTKPGGKVLLSEEFAEPLRSLNGLRRICGIEPIVPQPFNRLISKRRLEGYLESRGLQFRTDAFSSIYFLGTRLLRELVLVDKGPDYMTPINGAFYDLERRFSGGSFGPQQLYIITKVKR